MSTTVNYKGSTITTVNNQTKTLTTAGTWLEGDIQLVDVTEGGAAVLSDETNATGTTAVITGDVPEYGTKTITENGTYAAEDDALDGYSSVTVNVSGGGGITVDDLATNSAPSGAITLSNSITTISHNAFVRKPITSITSVCTTAQNYVFQLCTSLKNVSLPNCTSIGQYAFDGCNALITANIPSCTSIGAYAFSGCTVLKTVILPNSAITIGNNAFQNCAALENIDFSNVAIIQYTAFRNANASGCTFNPTTVNDSSFRDTKNFNVGFFPRLTTINGTYGFAGCFSGSKGCTITAVVFPVLSTIASNYSLSYSHNIAAMDIGNLTTIQQFTFRDNSVMSTLILRKSSVTTLSNINAFLDTPFASGGTGGTIYVPSALIDSYKSATNWSTLNGYGTVTWAAIEGSQYENYYADGTAIS